MEMLLSCPAHWHGPADATLLGSQQIWRMVGPGDHRPAAFLQIQRAQYPADFTSKDLL